MFWGRVAASATACTNCTRAFWYCSNTWSKLALILPGTSHGRKSTRQVVVEKTGEVLVSLSSKIVVTEAAQFIVFG
jgi:hypothetical protein